MGGRESLGFYLCEVMTASMGNVTMVHSTQQGPCLGELAFWWEAGDMVGSCGGPETEQSQELGSTFQVK